MSKKQEKEIQKLMSALEISREEALEMLEFDKGNVDNEEVEKIEEKEKEVDKKPKKKTDSLAKVKMQKAKKKEDLVKDGIMAKINEMVNWGEEFNAPQGMTSSKVTFTSSDGNFYSISLTKHKAKPDGYSEKSEQKVGEEIPLQIKKKNLKKKLDTSMVTWYNQIQQRDRK